MIIKPSIAAAIIGSAVLTLVAYCTFALTNVPEPQVRLLETAGPHTGTVTPTAFPRVAAASTRQQAVTVAASAPDVRPILRDRYQTPPAVMAWRRKGGPVTEEAMTAFRNAVDTIVTHGLKQQSFGLLRDLLNMHIRAESLGDAHADRLLTFSRLAAEQEKTYILSSLDRGCTKDAAYALAVNVKLIGDVYGQGTLPDWYGSVHQQVEAARPVIATTPEATAIAEEDRKRHLGCAQG